jgi:hypothetical protein
MTAATAPMTAATAPMTAAATASVAATSTAPVAATSTAPVGKRDIGSAEWPAKREPECAETCGKSKDDEFSVDRPHDISPCKTSLFLAFGRAPVL